MNRTALSLVSLAAALAVPLAMASAASAQAASPAHPGGKGRLAHVATNQHAPSSKMSRLAPMSVLAGYQQFSSALLTDSANTQTEGTVSCPSGTRLVGGGAVISGTSLGENLNSSLPSTNGLTWEVWVNNSNAIDGTFRVYADCVKKVAKYTVVPGAGVSNSPGVQNTASATCPSGTVPLGGGGIASSTSTAVNLNTSIPTSTGWRADTNNASASGNTATVYAICGKKPTGYAQIQGAVSTVNASSQASASVTCPSGTLVLSGGGFSNSGSTSVDMNSSEPAGSSGWIVYENNAATFGTSLTAYAVCGTASV